VSDPYCDACKFCGGPGVLDDAYYCSKRECWEAYEQECRDAISYEQRTPLTHSKSQEDLMATRASVWGTPYLEMERAGERLLAVLS
jgi:hypothetical protein